MKILTTKAHGFIDYIIGTAMILSPWILEIHQQLAAYILIIAGGITIIRSLITDYECGIVCQINMQQHIKTDIISGLLLAACPLLLNIEAIATPIIFGLLQVGIAIVSQSVPSYKGYHGLVYKKFEKFPSMKY